MNPKDTQDMLDTVRGLVQVDDVAAASELLWHVYPIPYSELLDRLGAEPLRRIHRHRQRTDSPTDTLNVCNPVGVAYAEFAALVRCDSFRERVPTTPPSVQPFGPYAAFPAIVIAANGDLVCDATRFRVRRSGHRGQCTGRAWSDRGRIVLTVGAGVRSHTVRMLVAHEMAHLMVPTEARHGPSWRSAYINLVVDRHMIPVGVLFDDSVSYYDLDRQIEDAIRHNRRVF